MARTAAGPPGEERQHQIMEAALRVFSRKGFDGATTKDIAAEAGVTAGLIYHYFEDKRALLEAIVTEHSPVGAATAALGQLEDMAELDPRVVLPLLATTLLAGMEERENGPAFHLLTGEAMHDTAMRERFNVGIARAVETLTDYLRGQIARGRLRPLDPGLVAQLFLGSLISTVMRRACMGDVMLCRYSREQIAATAVEMILGGLEVPVASAGATRTD